MCLLTNTEQLSAGEAAEQKAVTYRENIEGGGHPARGGQSSQSLGGVQPLKWHLRSCNPLQRTDW
jgi:hypothetical protein